MQDESKRDRRGAYHKNDQRRRSQANPARARVLRRRRIRRSLEPKRHARRASERGRVRDVVGASCSRTRRPTLRLATLNYCLRRRESAPSTTRIFYTAPGRGRYSAVKFLRYLGFRASTRLLRFSSSPPRKGATKTS